MRHLGLRRKPDEKRNHLTREAQEQRGLPKGEYRRRWVVITLGEHGVICGEDDE
jgi:hypothetical protein